jgi:hydroxymethylpyrimidine kinase/phosphomethylpyrimidine kinase/thiamine-phosphate diphosphorylase
VHAPPASFLRQQLDCLRSDLPPVAIKIGMLGTKELVETVGDFLSNVRKAEEQSAKVWVVLDPVMISTSGHRLIEEEAQQAMIDHVFPYADILTPNKFEAEAILNRKLQSLNDVEEAARDLLNLGVSAVLIKGGHSTEDSSHALDYFLSSSKEPAQEPRLCDGQTGVWLQSPRYVTEHTHGTGCTLSSAIASALALGEQKRSLEEEGIVQSLDAVDACCLAKAYVTAGIAQGVQLGQGPGPVAQTVFPASHEHYPRIVADPTGARGSQTAAFRPMLRAAGRGAPLEEEDVVVPTLGRILPIVDSVEWVGRLCKTGGVRDIQLRIKGETDETRILDKVRQCQALCEAAGVRLWINDYWRAAVDAGCFGVHVGQEDLLRCMQASGLDVLRRNNVALGISTHSYGELAAALGVRPSYVSLGPVFATSSKNVKFAPQGVQTVSKWRELIPPEIPLVAIGGIGDAATATAVREAGADSVAVIGAVTSIEDTKGAVSELNKAMMTGVH